MQAWHTHDPDTPLAVWVIVSPRALRRFIAEWLTPLAASHGGAAWQAYIPTPREIHLLRACDPAACTPAIAALVRSGDIRVQYQMAYAPITVPAAHAHVVRNLQAACKLACDYLIPGSLAEAMRAYDLIRAHFQGSGSISEPTLAIVEEALKHLLSRKRWGVA